MNAKYVRIAKLSRLMKSRFPINHSHTAKKRNLRCFVARRGWSPFVGTIAATPSRRRIHDRFATKKFMDAYLERLQML